MPAMNYFLILSLLPRELIKGEKFAILLNIHGGDICVVPTHLVWNLNLIMTAFRSFLFKLYILMLIGNQEWPKQDIAFIAPCSQLITEFLISMIRHVQLVEQELFLHYLTNRVRSQTLKCSGFSGFNLSIYMSSRSWFRVVMSAMIST